MLTHARTTKSYFVLDETLFETPLFDPQPPETSIAEFVRGSLNCFCITLYNEKCAELEASLVELMRSTAHLSEQRAGKDCKATICVVGDGIERMDPAVFELMAKLDLERMPIAEFGESINSYVSVATPAEFLRRLLGTAEQDPPGEYACPLVVCFCLKHQNTGKLQSHEIFFSKLCEWCQPRYCYQIDTGTTVALDGVAAIVHAFETRPIVGAFAPQVMPRIPIFDSDFLLEWQYFDFAFSRGLAWPLEVATGHLSVLPGQMSAFRWSALSEKLKDASYRSPVDAYLRGLSTSSALERVMFLAEDRVLGTELILADTDWRLEYIPNARATTDHCERFGELFRQRRRWINSALTCRLWLLSKLPKQVMRPDRSMSRKLTFGTASIAQSVLGFRDLLAPGILAALILVLFPVFAGAHTPAAGLLAWTFASASVAELLLALSMQRWGISARLNRTRAVIGYGAAAAYVGLIASMPLVTALVLLAPALTLVPIMYVLPRKAYPTLLRMQFSPFVGLTMLSATCAYALFNLGDVSWGTKGLLHSNVDSGIQRRLTQARTLTVLAWAGLNGAVISLAATYRSSDTFLNVVTALVAASDFLLAVGAISALATTTVSFVRRRSRAGGPGGVQVLGTTGRPSRRR